LVAAMRPKSCGFVHDRGEEIGGGDERLRVVQPVDRGVIGRFGADQEVFRKDTLDLGTREDLRQYRRRNLAAAAAAVAELGEANLFRCVHSEGT
jgi:hypothetical protein